LVERFIPSPVLLRNYKTGLITWQQFSEEFKKQMRNSEKAQQLIKGLREFCTKKDQNITLLCYEKEGGENCHRHIVKQLIEEGEGEEGE
jgi:uncharacterized protein YeaO (DUF488 family)